MHKIASIAFLIFPPAIGAIGQNNALLNTTQYNWAYFESQIEKARIKYHIPGLSAGVVKGGKLIWSKGFGYSDIENKITPDENTTYQIASVSKTFASIVLMQLVEEGKVSLDDPVAKYGVNLGGRWGGDQRIKVKHLLTHTAMGNSLNAFKPGYSFRYNGDWYARLTRVIKKSSGKQYGELLMNQIVNPLKMTCTTPSTDDTTNFRLSGFNRTDYLGRTAKPYDWQHHKFSPVNYKYSFSAAAGIMSCVSDLAKYAIAVEQKKFLKADTWEQVFTPFKTHNGKEIQYGLGWFVKEYNGRKIIWHTGWWTGYSALFILVPEEELAFIILANSQDLSRPFYHIITPIPGIGFFNPFSKNLNSSVMASRFGRAFIEEFVDGGKK